MGESVTIQLTKDEALVLSHLLHRFERTDQLCLANNAEFVALNAISAQLDELLVEPFMSNYSDLLTSARERLAAGFEGLAPGVTPAADD